MPDPHDRSARLAWHLVVHGRVQGVYYRASAQAEASRLGLSGWVRNHRDGTVEAFVCGAADGVDKFVAWARSGPPAARVDRLDLSAADPVDGGEFSVRPTA